MSAASCISTGAHLHPPMTTQHDLVSRAHAAFSQHWLRRGADPARQRLLAYAVLRRHKAHAGIYRHLHYPDLRAAPVRGEVFVTPAL